MAPVAKAVSLCTSEKPQKLYELSKYPDCESRVCASVLLPPFLKSSRSSSESLQMFWKDSLFCFSVPIETSVCYSRQFSLYLTTYCLRIYGNILFKNIWKFQNLKCCFQILHLKEVKGLKNLAETYISLTSFYIWVFVYAEVKYANINTKFLLFCVFTKSMYNVLCRNWSFWVNLTLILTSSDWETPFTCSFFHCFWLSFTYPCFHYFLTLYCAKALCQILWGHRDE